jgi:hypothetical protein
MKLILRVLSGLLFVLLGWKSSMAAFTIDQQQPVINTRLGLYGIIEEDNRQQMLAQVVTTGMSGFLTGTRLPVICMDDANLIIEIQDVTGDTPNGFVLTSEIISGASLPYFGLDTVSFRSLFFSKPIYLNERSQFAIVLKASGGTCGIYPGPSGDSYSGGNMYYDLSPSTAGIWNCLCEFPRASYDLPFETLVETVSQVTVEINNSGSIFENINLKNKGVIQIAILTTDDFDATLVDPLTVEFGPNGAMEAHGKGHAEDVDGDGALDLLFHFKTQEAGINCDDNNAFLTGETFDGQNIEGSVSISVGKCY